MLGEAGNKWGWRRWVAVAIALSTLSLQTGCRAEVPWPLWQQYRARFIDGSGRVIDHSPGANEKTTSEGMAYGMFFALVVNDRPTFDKLLRWTEDNLAGGDLTARLPAWNWGKSPDGEWKPLDTNSASDADLWMAYDLLEAGRLWKDDRLTKLGDVMMDRIAHTEVAVSPSLGTVLLPGPTGFKPQPNTMILNPSYSPPQVLARLKAEQPSGPWEAALDALPRLIAASAPSGFAMDWVLSGAKTVPSVSPTDLAAGNTTVAPVGGFESIRVYLWLGMADKGTAVVQRSLQSVGGMARLMESTVTPPMQVDAAGTVVNADGPVGFSAAVIPYLLAVGHKDQATAQANRMAASVDSASGLYGRTPLYYDQNLAMFSNGWTEGRFKFDRDGKLKVKWK
ncbi:endoglucanase Y [Terriglobus roseus DSM 18391]|uniref:cellulase n=1 Tax=Terriglobus roseus (strain DSM 18391 / NRRL B-41598 / KBS 63) TaxID=926566 RepID=I3ZES3_TERRK|nr:cellulose synthase complex periplasmic endoglucanase BcsZ [Terriglobus roseus]AFL87741.1 endoglucanase Y [Terriglobus roseus DSM 18391]